MKETLCCILPLSPWQRKKSGQIHIFINHLGNINAKALAGKEDFFQKGLQKDVRHAMIKLYVQVWRRPPK
jgi:hypothetical protein